MPRPDLAEVLLGRRLQVKGKAKAKRSTAQLTRAQRLALAPKTPSGVAYFKVLSKVLEGIQAQVKEGVTPILSEVVGGYKGPAMRTQEEEPDPTGLVMRVDVWTGPWAARFGALEVAIREATSHAALRARLIQLVEQVDESNKGEMERVLQVNLRRDPSLITFLDGFIRENVRLIRSISFTMLQSVERVVSRAQGSGVRVEVLAKEIEKTFAVTRSRAALIARDQTLKANANLTQLRQQRLGVTEYIWSCSRDERVRGRPDGTYPNPSPSGKTMSDHWALDGTRQRWAVPPVTNEATGAQNHPGQDYQCRCVALPVLDVLFEGL